jgi:hypothetical protein
MLHRFAPRGSFYNYLRMYICDLYLFHHHQCFLISDRGLSVGHHTDHCEASGESSSGSSRKVLLVTRSRLSQMNMDVN